MKITCNRRDDIIKRRDEYEARFNESKERYEAQYSDYRKARNDVTSLIEEEIKAQLNRFSALDFGITAMEGRWGTGGIEVSIQCNQNTKFNDDVALAWNYGVQLTKDGEVIKESSSWSGLKATTSAQLESLTQTLEALKYLNSVDWSKALNRDMPKYDDYVTDKMPTRTDRPDFESELFEADIEEAVGAPVLIKGFAGPSSGFRQGVEVYYMIHKETPTQYLVSEAWAPRVDSIIDEEGKEAGMDKVREGNEYRIKKSNFRNLVKNPLTLIK